MKLSWGKPSEIQIGKLGDNDAAPTNWITVDNPVKDSTQLTTNDGEQQKAEGEGGELVDLKQGASTYEMAWENFVKKGVNLPVIDVDGNVPGFYAFRLVPEDKTCEGIQFAKAVLTAGESYTASDGKKKPYKMFVINETDGSKTIKPYFKDKPIVVTFLDLDGGIVKMVNIASGGTVADTDKPSAPTGYQYTVGNSITAHTVIKPTATSGS